MIEISFLQGVLLFKNLSPDSLQALQDRGTERSIEEGSFFFQQEDQAKYVYVLFAGRVKLYQLTVDGQQVVMRIIVPGQMFGGAGVLHEGKNYPASALAIEDSRAYAWEGDFLSELAIQDSALSFNLLSLMHTYVEEMQNRFRELATERVERRVAHAILRLAAQSGQKVPKGIDLRCNRQDIAAITGTTLYTVSRLLSEWERRGVISAGREHIIIREPHKLVQIAEDLDR